MESKQYLNLFILFQSYERVYVDPFHEIVREYIHQLGNAGLIKDFQKLEESYNQILEDIKQYKSDFLIIQNDKMKTTKEKDKSKETLFDKFYTSLTNNVIDYLHNKQDFMTTNIIPMAKTAIEELKSDKRIKGEVVQFYQQLQSRETMVGNTPDEAKIFIDNRLEERYKFKSARLSERTELYYDRKGTLHFYKQAVTEELKKYSLSPDSVNWFSDLHYTLYDNGIVKTLDISGLVEYLAEKTEALIEEQEQEDIRTLQAFESLSASKQGLLSRWFKR